MSFCKLNIKFKLLFILIFLQSYCFSQIQIDDVVSFNFAKKVNLFERSDKNISVKGFNHYTASESLIFIRSVKIEENGNESINNLSENLNDLMLKYEYTSKLLIKELRVKKFELLDSSLIDYKGFVVSKLVFENYVENKRSYIILIDLNGVLYYVIHTFEYKFDNDKDDFILKSIFIKDIKNQKQTRSKAEKNSISIIDSKPKSHKG